MSISQKRHDLQKVLHRIQWLVPALMSSIAVIYTAIEHQRHIDDPAWPWPTFLAISVLDVSGPLFYWLVLR